MEVMRTSQEAVLTIVEVGHPIGPSFYLTALFDALNGRSTIRWSVHPPPS